MILGLTGGIGSGKSFIANEFSKLGIPTYNSDIHAKFLMSQHPEIISKLTEKFGSNAYINGELNRKLIANKIFNNKAMIDWINKLVHPIVANNFTDWIDKQQSKFVIKEAAILIESGSHKQCNKILVVTAPEQIRIDRVIKRDNMTSEEIISRINNQISDKERLKYADFVINNNGTVVVEKDVKNIYNKIIQEYNL